MGKAIQKREPLTEQEVWDYLTIKVEREERHWGEDSYYANAQRKYRDTQMEKYHNGEVVCVHSESYVDSYGNGCGDFEDKLYSDGHVETYCFGYLD